MDDALTESKHKLGHTLVRSCQLDIKPFVADRWVMISLLQKSIRRGETAAAGPRLAQDVRR
jgi:hypothetical protein